MATKAPTPLFGNKLRDAINNRRLEHGNEEAIKWLREKARNTRTNTINGEKLIGKAAAQPVKPITVGRMFFFKYDAKLKETLPYWDMFPLIFPIGPAKDGFLGINMHYLPPPLRAKLMDALYDNINNSKLDESTKLKISYDILKGASKFKYFEPCIKHYLNSHVSSKLVYIDPKEWDYALFLPLQKFQKAHSNKVYADSRKIINKR